MVEQDKRDSSNAGETGDAPQAGGPAAPEGSSTPPPLAATPEEIASAGTPASADQPIVKQEPVKEATEPASPALPAGTIADSIREALPELQFQASQGMTNVIVEVARDDVGATLPVLKEDARLRLNLLRCLFGIDHGEEGMEVVYELLSTEKGHAVTVKTRLASGDLRVPSASGVWKAADWHERETRDMFGIEFDGHPHLVPLLLPEDMTDHFPLRKDNPLQEIEEWQGELVAGAGAADAEEAEGE
jgi:NADH-quinone oxidoreductase subunit C